MVGCDWLLLHLSGGFKGLWRETTGKGAQPIRWRRLYPAHRLCWLIVHSLKKLLLLFSHIFQLNLHQNCNILLIKITLCRSLYKIALGLRIEKPKGKKVKLGRDSSLPDWMTMRDINCFIIRNFSFAQRHGQRCCCQWPSLARSSCQAWPALRWQRGPLALSLSDLQLLKHIINCLKYKYVLCLLYLMSL